MNAETLQWIDEQKPALVLAARGYLQEHKIFEDREEKYDARVSSSQLRNLWNAAHSGSSLAVLTNFLRYQNGRGHRGWGDREAGEALETLLELEVGKRGGARLDAGSPQRYALEAQLAALFFGFLIHEYTYQRAKIEEKKRARRPR